MSAGQLVTACTGCGRPRVHADLVGGDLCGRCRGLPATTEPTGPWTVRSTFGRPLTVNAVAGLHRQAWARHTAEVRGVWFLLAREAKVPRLDRAVITATPLHADARSPQDVAACAPEVKAAVDGLVDAHVLPDDDPEHLLGIVFLPPRLDGVDGLELLIEAA